MKAIPLADKLEIWGFENDFVLFSDGSSGFALSLDGADTSAWDNAKIDAFAHRISAFLNALPSGIDVQFILEVISADESILEKYNSLTSSGLSANVQRLVLNRHQSLRGRLSDGLIPDYRLTLLIRKPLTRTQKRPGIFAKSKLFPETTERELEEQIRSCEQLREEVVRGLANLDLSAAVLTQKEIALRIYNQWNPERNADLLNYDKDDVRADLVFTDAVLDEKGFSLSDAKYRVLSLKNLPDQTYAGMAQALAELPLKSKAFITISIPDQLTELDKLQTQRRIAFSMARGKRTGVSDIESEAKLADLETVIQQLVTSGEKIFWMSLNVLVQANTEPELDEMCSRVLSSIRDLSNAEGMEETVAAFDVFSEFSYPNARAKERSKRLKTSNAADFLPIHLPWKGHDRPRMLLRSRLGSFTAFDPFSSTLSNYNQIVTGGSGSGKSFLTNLLLLQMLRENPRIFIVDIGGSYRKLCENLDGQYVALDLSFQGGLNPFDLSAGETIPSSQKIKFLVGLIELMTKEDGAETLGRLERAEIEDAIQKVYEAEKKPRLTHLMEFLSKHTDPQIRRFGRILGPWCGNTPYGKFIDRPSSIELTRSLVSFDLKGLESYPDLQAVTLFLITDFVWREVQRDRSIQKFLVMDECWKLLENPSGAAFIGEVFRTFRKYFASAIAISQNIDDFAKSRVSTAILPNTSIKWVLMQKGSDKDRLKEALHLNDTEIGIIEHLHQVRGVYSQAFLMAEERHTLVNIEPTALEYWVATTDARDLSKIEQTHKEFPNWSAFEVLEYLSQKFPQGVSVSGGTK